MKALDLGRPSIHSTLYEVQRGEGALSDFPIRSHEFIGEGDAGTLGATVPWMQTLVQEGRDNPIVAAQAAEICSRFPYMHPVAAVFRFVQSLPYVYDEELLARRGVDPADTSELLQGAPYQVAKYRSSGSQSVEGDCDDRAILTQSLLEAMPAYRGRTRFVLVRGPERDDYSHVYSEVALETGQWIPLDTIFDGKGGRPVYAPGDEVGAPEGARDRVSIPVEQTGGSGFLLALLGWLFLHGGRS